MRSWVRTGTAAAMLALIAATPAMAQDKKAKKEKPGAAPKANFSPAFQKAALPAQEAVKPLVNAAPGAAAADPALKAAAADALAKYDAAELAATTPDDKFMVGQGRFTVARVIEDRVLLRKALIAMADSGSTLVANRSLLMREAGKLAYEAKDNDDALARFTAAAAIEPLDAQSEIFLGSVYFNKGDAKNGALHANRALELAAASGKPADPSWFSVARQGALKAGLIAESSEISRKMIAAYPTRENWQNGIAYYINTAKPNDALRVDMFRLMRETQSVADASTYREFADLLDRLRAPGEAYAVLNEGVSNGKLNRSDTRVAERLKALESVVAADKRTLIESERRAQAAAEGRVAANLADTYLGYGDAAKAVQFYQLALTKPGIDANAVNLRLGQALIKAGRKAEAAAVLDKVSGPQAEVARFWKLHATATV